MTDYVEEDTHFDHVWRFADKDDGLHGGDPRLAQQASRRRRHPDRRRSEGVSAWQPACWPMLKRAFAVVHHECGATSYTVAHEIRHLIGARHDLNLDTISCGGCPRVPVRSSPKVMVKGERAGTPELDNAPNRRHECSTPMTTTRSKTIGVGGKSNARRPNVDLTWINVRSSSCCQN